MGFCASLKENETNSAYFEIDGLSLYHADSLNTSLFSSPFVDLIVTSPPYNVGIDKTYCEIAKNRIECETETFSFYG